MEDEQVAVVMDRATENSDRHYCRGGGRADSNRYELIVLSFHSKSRSVICCAHKLRIVINMFCKTKTEAVVAPPVVKKDITEMTQEEKEEAEAATKV